MNTDRPPLHRSAMPRRAPRGAVMPRRAQRGVVMLYGLIALVIMLIGAVAMARSMNTSLFNAGNLGFKRDLTNQGERAVAQAMNSLTAGALASSVARQANSQAGNYSAQMLPSNAQGVPTALLDDAAFAAVGSSANDIVIADQGVTLRYVIDRLCTEPGAADPAKCSMVDNGLPLGVSGVNLYDGGAEVDTSGGAGAVPTQAVYRLTVRVTGPRRTQAFLQTTFTL